MRSLRVDNLSYAYYKNDLVIKNMTVELEFNKIHTLLGLNGSGKTTLIKLLAGLFAPKTGAVYLNGQDLRLISNLEKSKSISYVRQGTTTGDDHFVKDYLSFGMMNQLSWYQSPTTQQLEKVNQTAIKFGIENILEKKMNELSGGQKQIVMICRAFVQDTDIIILDEPTSALDFKNQSLVLKLLKDLVVSENKTIILSTHNPNHALYLDSNVILIKDGMIVKSGCSKDMITTEMLKQVYGSNVAYSNDLDYREVTIN